MPRLLELFCCAVRGDCARGHGRACGAAERSGLGCSGLIRGAWNKSICSVFLHVFFAVSLCTKNGEEGHRAFFCHLCGHSASKMMQSGTGPFFVIFVALPPVAKKTAVKGSGFFAAFCGGVPQLQKRCHSASFLMQSDTGPFF